MNADFILSLIFFLTAVVIVIYLVAQDRRNNE